MVTQEGDAAQRLRATFDHAWLLTTLLAAALLIVSWYLGFVSINVVRAVSLLALLTGAQLGLVSATRHVRDTHALQRAVLGSQLLGTVIIGSVWHLAGGLQQPLFPVLILLPLLPAFLLLNLWRRFLACATLVLVLLTGALLSPNAANSFLDDRYGLRTMQLPSLPDWIPRSHIAFADVSTSTPYEIMLVTTLAVVTIALAATAGVVAALSGKLQQRSLHLRDEVSRLQALNHQLIAAAPAAEILVASSTGKIVSASERFCREFAWRPSAGSFLLDATTFRYPDVIKRLLATGGEDVQAVLVQGREMFVRVHAVPVGATDESLTRVCFERSDELAWRGAVNALDEPVFAVNAASQVVFPNRAMLELFGATVEGRVAETLFDGSADRWWDISPLNSARRIVRHGTNRYIATIRRERLTSSIGDVTLVRLTVNKGLQAA
jgi:PAS domain-containing protein